MKAATQAFKLVVDLPPAGFQRIRQGWIDCPQLFAQIIQLAINCPFGFCERFCCLCAEMLFYHPRQNIIQTGKQVHQAEAVFFQQTSGVSLNHRQAGAREDWRDWPGQQTIDFAGLSEVSDFSGASIIGNRRQEIILDHSAQRYIRTKALGLR